MVVRRFDVYLVTLDPTVGSEMQKIRPCLVVSPDDLNQQVRTVIIAPLTTQGPLLSSRVPCVFQGKLGRVVLDQVRTVDKSRLIRWLGPINPAVQTAVLAVLERMFSK